MNLFGKKKPVAAPPSDPTPVIIRLRETLETLDKREVHLQKKIKGQLLEAKAKSQSKDKKAALFALKRKKMYEGEINKINGARMTLEQQVIALEGSNMNYQTFRAMQTGADAMKAARGQLDVDEVDTVMDDIQEEMDIADQISDAIARPAEGIFDDDDLLAELNAMEEEAIDSTLLDVPSIPQRISTPTPIVAPVPSQNVVFPVAPNNALRKPVATPAVAIEEDEDLRALKELEASMM
jgi:charged multivesicular body protein 4